MAIHVTAFNTTTPIDAPTSGDVWVINPNVLVTATFTGINGGGVNGNKTFLIYGGLIAEGPSGHGIVIGDFANNVASGGFNNVHIMAGGSIYADLKGIFSVSGNLNFINEGTVNAANEGVYAANGENTIVNNGTVSASTIGLLALGFNNTIVNGGSIYSGSAGIQSLSGFSTITSTGTISSGTQGISVAGASNVISNSGVLTAIAEGILATGTANTIINDGTIRSRVDGISSGAFSRAENYGSITATNYGIEMTGGNNAAENHGAISALYSGLFMTGDNNLAVNSGVITTTLGEGISVLGGTGTKVINSGDIYCGVNAITGISVSTNAGAFSFITNTGFVSATLAVSTGAGTDSLINGLTGALHGIVALGGGDDVITNDGDIFGIVDLGEGNDSLLNTGHINGDVLMRGGNDSVDLSGGSVAGTVFGGEGVDRLLGGSSDDVFVGGQGGDTINGRAGEDTASYLDSNSAVSVNLALTGAQNTLGAGFDTLRRIENLTGSAHNDVLRGNSAANEIDGGAGNDTLNGAAGDDTIFGRAGDDTIDGGPGLDTMFGGSGTDNFVFSSALKASNAGTISDFSVADDTVRLENAIFTLLGAPGTLAANNFTIGGAAADADDFVIYDSTTGALYYDPNGNVAGGQIQFATLAAGLALTNADFELI